MTNKPITHCSTCGTHWTDADIFQNNMCASCLYKKVKKYESEVILDVSNPLFDGLCGGVEPNILYATIRHLKKELNFYKAKNEHNT